MKKEIPFLIHCQINKSVIVFVQFLHAVLQNEIVPDIGDEQADKNRQKYSDENVLRHHNANKANGALA